MTITFVGHGYVGLVTATVFADLGNTVHVIGHTHEKIERLKKGDPIIFEPGLEELLKKNIEAKRIHFTTEYEHAVGESDVVFIAVGTPPQTSGAADLSAVFDVAEKIGKHLKKGFTVVSCKSTVTIGTNKKVAESIKSVKPEGAEFAIASCPEFLSQGTALQNTLYPDRVVIGSDSKKAIDIMIGLHEGINSPKVITSLASAELIKYTANAILSTKISFANLISFYSEKTGANVEEVLDAVGLDKRIGRVFMNPGIGYGGSCFPKDTKALIQIGKSLGIDTTLLDGVDSVNTEARDNILQKILTHAQGKNVALWGLSFKPNTDDIRDAPAIYLIKDLLDKGFSVTAYDPEGMPKTRAVFNDQITLVDDPYTCVENADILVIATEWNEFRQVDLEKVKRLLKTPVIVDGRNIYDSEKVKALGFEYIGVGR
ncbi:MAG TPA: UDP-glucose/GDP-mannose dehydrogenase family protein [Candidatus Saccharimonadales bacterium]|nr:UDP-glucose/GDP-mannose dehydrogenase family protein [Candidatus Saccharimonadales bacterium]